MLEELIQRIEAEADRRAEAQAQAVEDCVAGAERYCLEDEALNAYREAAKAMHDVAVKYDISFICAAQVGLGDPQQDGSRFCENIVSSAYMNMNSRPSEVIFMIHELVNQGETSSHGFTH